MIRKKKCLPLFLTFVGLISLFLLWEDSLKFSLQSTQVELGEAERLGRPWYLLGGTQWPAPASIDSRTGRRKAKLWPEENRASDRILEQLMFIPPNADDRRPKTILLQDGLRYSTMWNITAGSSAFSSCPVSNCIVIEHGLADAVVFTDDSRPPERPKPENQIWIYFNLESPAHTPLPRYGVFNWTITYRRDSDVVFPYGRWVPYDGVFKTSRTVNYAASKTKKVAMFVSNCLDKNGRLGYAHKLRNYTTVDIFGGCGEKQCPRSRERDCFRMLRDEYKFYLAFENSNCKDYITEKFFVNAQGHNVIPIVMGAEREDYERVAPPHSFIHVDDFESPKELAEYLQKLDKDDDLYNSYFKWKGTGEFNGNFLFCRLCALLNDDPPTKFYPNLHEWLKQPGICHKKGSEDEKVGTTRKSLIFSFW